MFFSSERRCLTINQQREVILRLESVHKIFISKSLFKKYETHVLKDVSFEVHRGETVALVGESGSGKSTTARIILGLEQATQGSVYFQNSDLSKVTKSEQRKIKRRMQVVFQDPLGSVNPRQTVQQILSEPLLSHDISKKETELTVKSLLTKVGLNESDLVKFPHQFSGGQLQRIGVARAIALNPDLIILDEPTSALDVSIQARILKLLKSLQKELKLTYLFITHDLNVVEAFADRVLVMRKGEIVERGSVQEIFHDPKHAYTQELLDSNLTV